MTSTDRAFIHAFQIPGAARDAAGEPAVALGPSRRSEAATAGPRRPLSEHLAARKATPADAPLQAFTPAVYIDDLQWPTAVAQLAEIARSSLLDVIAASTAKGAAAECPTLALAGAAPAVGATTATLAIAHLIGGLGGRVAVIDAGGGACEALGIGLTRSPIDDTGRSIDARSLAGRARHTTIIACDLTESSTKATAAAFSRVAQEHDLLLIDAAWVGSADVSPLSDASVTTLLVDHANGPSRVRGVALARLRAAGVEATGVVETLAD